MIRIDSKSPQVKHDMTPLYILLWFHSFWLVDWPASSSCLLQRHGDGMRFYCFMLHGAAHFQPRCRLSNYWNEQEPCWPPRGNNTIVPIFQMVMNITYCPSTGIFFFLAWSWNVLGGTEVGCYKQVHVQFSVSLFSFTYLNALRCTCFTERLLRS